MGKRQNRSRRIGSTKVSSPSSATGDTATATEQVAVLKRQVRVLRRERNELQDVLASRAGLERLIASALAEDPVEAYPIRVPMPDQSDHRHPASVVYPQADWHTGLVVQPAEVQGYGRYDWKTAEHRRQIGLKRFLQWTALHSQVYDIQECVVPGLADWVDGTIHVENLMYSEFATPRAAVLAGRALGRLLLSLAMHFRIVRFEGVSGNHDRIFPKPIYTGRNEWSWSFIVYEVARLVCQSADNVKFTAHPGIKADIRIGRHTLLIEHGDGLRTQFGLPYYSLRRMVNQEAQRRAIAGKRPVLLHLLGHWHQEHKDAYSIIVPSLCGTTPYDHAVGRHGPPGQTCFLIGRRGLFDYLCIDLSKD